MTPATPITKRDEIKSAKEGFLYKRRTAVCQMLPVMQNDGRCRLRFDYRTNRPLRREAAEIGRLRTGALTGVRVGTTNEFGTHRTRTRTRTVHR